MSPICEETKEYFSKIQKSPCQECGECQGILQNRMRKLASSDVTDAYADLTVKTPNPDGSRTTHLHWELRPRLTWPGPISVPPEEPPLPGSALLPCAPATLPAAHTQSNPRPLTPNVAFSKEPKQAKPGGTRQGDCAHHGRGT